jgi:hypothetical protein
MQTKLHVAFMAKKFDFKDSRDRRASNIQYSGCAEFKPHFEGILLYRGVTYCLSAWRP